MVTRLQRNDSVTHAAPRSWVASSVLGCPVVAKCDTFTFDALVGDNVSSDLPWPGALSWGGRGGANSDQGRNRPGDRRLHFARDESGGRAEGRVPDYSARHS